MDTLGFETTQRASRRLLIGLSKVTAKVTAVLAIAATGTIGPVASASPGQGVTAENVVSAAPLLEVAHINEERIKFQTKDPTVVRVQKLTFAAGSFTGWHRHPGVLVVAVRSGSVTLVDTDCTSKTYGPGMPDGAAFIDGFDHPHEARSAAGAELWVTYVAPTAVFRFEEPVQTCP